MEKISGIPISLREFADHIEGAITNYNSLTRIHTERVDMLEAEKSTLLAEKAKLTRDLEDRSNEVSTLKEELAKLREENAAFSRVSHIIAMEKENARLRGEVKTLTERLATAKPASQAPQASQAPPQPLPPTPSPTEDQGDEEFYEKKIKGAVFFISASTSIVYENVEGEVGQRVGRLDKKDGKLKVVWD